MEAQAGAPVARSGQGCLERSEHRGIPPLRKSVRHEDVDRPKGCLRLTFELVHPGEGALDHPAHLAQSGAVDDTASGDHGQCGFVPRWRQRPGRRRACLERFLVGYGLRPWLCRGT